MTQATRPCRPDERAAILAIINDAARAYAGIIPADRYHEPYMSDVELQAEMAAGIHFHGRDVEDELVGVMGIQDVKDVTLIRHAYVSTAQRGKGIGGTLLEDLRLGTERPMLIGTWAAAEWAIRFYEKHDFRLVPRADVPDLLNRYWSIPARQVETSVVLAAPEWFSRST